MSHLDDMDRSELTRQLQEEFSKGEHDETPRPKHIQRYSESTKTLYSDEEMALKKIHNIEPIFEEEEKKDLSMDEMMQLLKKEPEETKPTRRGYAVHHETKGKWHSDN